MKRKSIFILMVLVLAPVLLFSQQSQNNRVNGFFANAGSFEILSRYQGKRNVLKVDRSKTNWYTAAYSLAQYWGKQIAIEFSADVRLEGSEGIIAFSVNNNPDYPTLINTENALEPGRWHSIKGRGIVTPMQNDPLFFLANWGLPENTVVYLANPTITITEVNLTPDLSLTPLKSIYQDHFLIGNISDWDGKYLKGQYFDLFKHHHNIVTSTVTFPHLIMPLNKGGAYRFADADAVVNIAVRNNIPVHGFVLVYYGGGQWGAPEWITEGTREEVLQNMNDYITTVVQHFKGRINSWDVINEAIKHSVTSAEARGDWRKCIADNYRDNRWYNKLGADYIERAFRAARAADPNITLYYSDYNLEDPNKAEVARKMILDINDRYKRETGGTRNLIEGIGWQGHLGLNTNIPITSTNFQKFNINQTLNNYRATLQKLSSLGIEIAISEVDISTVGHIQNTGMDSDMSERDAITQAVYYAKLFSMFKEFSAHIKRVSFWNMTDNTSWLSPGNPTLFDWKLNAKPAFHAVSDPEGFLKQNKR